MKRVIVFILAVSLCLSLCACGNYRTDSGMSGSGTTENGSDMLPDSAGGYVDDNQADNGVVDDNTVTPYPRSTHRP